MSSSFIVRFRPTGPWRFGPGSGAREQVDLLLHSDAVYSAVTNAMASLDMLEDWLRDTARNESGVPAVRFSSLFPYHRDILFVAPPRSLWPPPPSAKLRYKGARFVPLSVVGALLTDQPLDEDRWAIDGESSCLVPGGWHDGPFRQSLRSGAAVDRLEPGKVILHATACLEFSRDAGVWLMAVFEDEAAQERWEKPVRGALRLLGDTGIGGERSQGWGRSREPRWEKMEPLPAPPVSSETESGWWLLSLYAPAPADAIDWSRGNYWTVERSGRANGDLKARTLMIGEGSVLIAPEAPRGAIHDVAPAGFAHPVYRSGFPVMIPIPWRAPV